MFSCSSDEPEISQEVLSFLDELVDVMEQNSINKNDIDWTEFKESVYKQADGAVTIDDATSAISEALTLLCDRHSFFITSSEEFIGGAKRVDCTLLDFTENVPKNEEIGYVQVEAFTGVSNEEMLDYALKIQNSIEEQDNEHIKGWIIDVRQNGGGNMFPMLAGVGSILGDGVAGYFISPDGLETPWGYSDGAAWTGQSIILTLPNPYELKKPQPKVAVLSDNGIASSGEALIISFIGRQNTRSFGEQTCGLSTANAAYTLNTSGTLILTVSTMADREKQIYGESVEPDVILGPAESIQAAIDYILE